MSRVLILIIKTNAMVSVIFNISFLFFFSKNHHTNPYGGEDTAWQGERADMRYSSRGQTSTDNVVGRIPGGGWQEESWDGRERIPMGYISSRPGSPSWQHDFSKWTRIQ